MAWLPLHVLSLTAKSHATCFLIPLPVFLSYPWTSYPSPLEQLSDAPSFPRMHHRSLRERSQTSQTWRNTGQILGTDVEVSANTFMGEGSGTKKPQQSTEKHNKTNSWINKSSLGTIIVIIITITIIIIIILRYEEYESWKD